VPPLSTERDTQTGPLGKSVARIRSSDRELRAVDRNEYIEMRTILYRVGPGIIVVEGVGCRDRRRHVLVDTINTKSYEVGPGAVSVKPTSTAGRSTATRQSGGYAISGRPCASPRPHPTGPAPRSRSATTSPLGPPARGKAPTPTLPLAALAGREAATGIVSDAPIIASKDILHRSSAYPEVENSVCVLGLLGRHPPARGIRGCVARRTCSD
jgi:hypothetical protein